MKNDTVVSKYYNFWMDYVKLFFANAHMNDASIRDWLWRKQTALFSFSASDNKYRASVSTWTSFRDGDFYVYPIFSKVYLLCHTDTTLCKTLKNHVISECQFSGFHLKIFQKSFLYFEKFSNSEVFCFLSSKKITPWVRYCFFIFKQ